MVQTVHTIHTVHTVHTVHIYSTSIHTHVRKCIPTLYAMVPYSSLPTCSKHLFALMKENFEEGPIHIRQKPRQNPPPTITPQNMGTDFRIEDVNTLELARQLTLICSQKFRDIRVSFLSTQLLCFHSVSVYFLWLLC